MDWEKNYFSCFSFKDKPFLMKHSLILSSAIIYFAWTSCILVSKINTLVSSAYNSSLESIFIPNVKSLINS
jgi:hypothetical protein